MKPASAKQKGRKLQQWCRDKVLETFPSLTTRDVRSTGMGQGGADLQLSEAAHRLFPYSVECKAREDTKKIYDIYEQAQGNGGEPLVVIKKNHKEPLVLMSAKHFFDLIKVENE